MPRASVTKIICTRFKKTLGQPSGAFLTDNEAAHEQLACGSPFLVATKAGYSTSYLNRPIEVSELHTRLVRTAHSPLHAAPVQSGPRFHCNAFAATFNADLML